MRRPRSLNQLVDALQKFPGVGPRTAQRMASAVLSMPYNDALEISRAVLRVKKTIITCSTCFTNTETDPCDICADEDRDKSFVCVVQDAEDVISFERAKSHPGLYHVLGGVINPNRGIGPEKIKVRELMERVSRGDVKEILLATDTSVPGDATAAYIISQLKGKGVKVTRLARGIPMGADIDYLDGETLQQAFYARREIDVTTSQENFDNKENEGESDDT